MTPQALWTYGIVGATFALYIGLGFWARAGSIREFYVAGGNLHPLANGMATAAAFLSAASFLSLAGLLALNGYGGSVLLMGWTGGYVLLALLLAPYLRQFGAVTVPGFIGKRYAARSVRVVAVLCLLLISLTYLIGQMTGIGVAFAGFFGLSYELSVAIGVSLVAIYALFGGMKGITYTQIAQYVVLIFAYTVAAIFMALQLTGQPIPQLALGSPLLNDPNGLSLLLQLDQVVTHLGFQHYTTHTLGSTFNMFVYSLSLMIGTAGLPHILMRFFTVPTVAAVRYSIGWTLVCLVLLYATAPAMGAMARWALLNSIHTGPIAEEHSYLLYAERPDWFKHWEATGLLTFTDHNGDGRIQYYDDRNPEFAVKAQEFGWEGNELALNADVLVLAMPTIADLPDWVLALMIAGALAAALATTAGLLLAIAAAFAHDLMKGLFAPNSSEKMELLAGRLAMLGAVLFAGYLSLHPPGVAAETVALALSLAAATLFPALLLGIFSTRFNQYGAIAGMLTGLMLTLGYIFQHKGLFWIPNTTFLIPEIGMGPNWLFGLMPEAFGAIGALANIAVAWLVSNFTTPPPQQIQHWITTRRASAYCDVDEK